MASRIKNALKSDKDRGTLEYLGCTIDEFRRHIELTFQPGMTWDNHGLHTVDGPRAWQVDHVIPIKYPGAAGGPPTIEEVGARLHWQNTQAMWAEDNMAKGNRNTARVNPPVWLTDEEFDEILARYY